MHLPLNAFDFYRTFRIIKWKCKHLRAIKLLQLNAIIYQTKLIESLPEIENLFS